MKKVGIIFGVVVCVVGLAFVVSQRNEQKLKGVTASTSSDSVSEEQIDERIAISREPRSSSVPAQNSIHSLDEPQLSDPVRSLLFQDEQEHNYPSLLAEINKLTYSLLDDDVAALIDMLAWPNDRFPEGMRPIEINAVKNDVLDKLLRQEILPEGVGRAMAEMAGDSSQDVVWRDYCVQFMGTFYDRAAAEQEFAPKNINGGAQASATADNEDVASLDELQIIRAAMFQALDVRGSTIAGTALIGLENLSRTHDEFDREEIIGKAVEIASDELASTESRLTALRLAAHLTAEGTGHKETAATARMLAQTGETVLMRSAAIVTLGEVGSASDRELLESYALDDNRQIVHAAKLALQRMDESLIAK